MTKTPYNSKSPINAPQSIPEYTAPWRQLFKITLNLLLITTLLIAAFPWLYEIKAKAGIDIFPHTHAGPLLEEYSHGIIKCEWLYPYHCGNRTSALIPKS